MKADSFSKFYVVSVFALGLLAIVCLPSLLYAAEQKAADSLSTPDGIPVYNPPLKNAETTRREADENNSEDSSISRGITRGLSRGVTRGLSRGLTMKGSENSGPEEEIPLPLHISPLAPQHTGLTSNPQPALLWYVSGYYPEKVEFRLNEIGTAESLVDTDIKGPDKEGIYRLDLADYRVSLKPDVEYEWFLTIVFDKNERSADFGASAAIRYVKLSEELSKRAANTPKEKQYYVYADQGYWYDAIDSLSRLIEAKPGDKTLKSYRAALLNQVKLPAAAAYDKNSIIIP